MATIGRMKEGARKDAINIANKLGKDTSKFSGSQKKNTGRNKFASKTTANKYGKNKSLPTQ